MPHGGPADDLSMAIHDRRYQLIPTSAVFAYEMALAGRQRLGLRHRPAAHRHDDRGDPKCARARLNPAWHAMSSTACRTMTCCTWTARRNLHRGGSGGSSRSSAAGLRARSPRSRKLYAARRTGMPANFRRGFRPALPQLKFVRWAVLALPAATPGPTQAAALATDRDQACRKSLRATGPDADAARPAFPTAALTVTGRFGLKATHRPGPLPRDPNLHGLMRTNGTSTCRGRRRQWGRTQSTKPMPCPMGQLPAAAQDPVPNLTRLGGNFRILGESPAPLAANHVIMVQAHSGSTVKIESA